MLKQANPVVGNVAGMCIWMNPKNDGAPSSSMQKHEPPHVHVGPNTGRTLVEPLIEDGSVYRKKGDIARNKFEDVQDFVKGNRRDLLAMWQLQSFFNIAKGRKVGSNTYYEPYQIQSIEFDGKHCCILFADDRSCTVSLDQMLKSSPSLCEAIANGEVSPEDFEIGCGSTQIEFAYGVEASGEYLWYVHACGKDWDDYSDYPTYYNSVMHEFHSTFDKEG